MKLNLIFTVCVVTLFVMLCTKNVSSIKCWECNSNFDVSCGDPFDNSTHPITDCALRPNLMNGVQVCRKIKHNFNGQWVVIRSCAVLTSGPGVRRQCGSVLDQILLDIEELCCETDLCNAS